MCVLQPVLVCQRLLLDCPVVLSQRNTFIGNVIYLKMSCEQKVILSIGQIFHVSVTSVLG